MIEVYVASYNGRSTPAELAGQFGPEGGTVGRGADNTLVLSDPARHVSRVQARIRYDGTRFLIGNVSEANPLFLNDAEVESGSERVLVLGDELRIGLYVLRVRAPVATQSVPTSAGPRAPVAGILLDPLAGLAGADAGPNPFADLLGTPVAAPLPPAEDLGSHPAPLASNTRGAATGTANRIAPATRPGGMDPFADLLGPNGLEASPSISQGTSFSAPPKPRITDRIPDDFNPLALPSSAPRNSDDPLRDLADSAIDLRAVDGNAKRNSLLEFDLAPNANPRDPLQGFTPSLVDSHQVVDPLQLFSDAENQLLGGGSDFDLLATGQPMRDNVPEIHGQFTPPRSVPETQGYSPVTSARPTSRPPPAAARPLPGLEPRNAPAPVHGVAHDAPAAPTSATSGPPPPEIEALLSAFLKGARVGGTAAPAHLTPALMEKMGAFVYHATAGTMELIAARQITKREIRAERTMIVAQGNNPLKFLPTPDAALLQMLGPMNSGYMAMDDAMRGAFDDLRAHEVGVIAGMRAALAEVLRRFDPVLLQERLGQGGALDALVPALRRAKLWDLFEARYRELYHEANDDFHSLFGAAFTKAYEEQIELNRAQRGRA